MSNIVKQGQSFMDKVTQLTGSWENALEVAILNNRSITEAVPIASELKANTITNKRVQEFFNAFNEPATGVTDEQIKEVENLGIGKMIIESTFIVG